MWNDIKGMIVGRKSSRDVAKGRLQLVLAHDRTGLDGGKLQEMREEITAVIAKYVSIDPEAVDLQIERVSSENTELRVSSPLSNHGVAS